MGTHGVNQQSQSWHGLHVMPSPRCKRSKITGSRTRGYTPRRQCANHLIAESPVVLRGKVSARDVHDVDHDADPFRPILALAMLVLTALGDPCTCGVLTWCRW